MTTSDGMTNRVKLRLLRIENQVFAGSGLDTFPEGQFDLCNFETFLFSHTNSEKINSLNLL